MKRYCTQCELISPVFDVWGPCRDCQPGFMSAIFEPAEQLADIEIVRPLAVFRTSALYDAKRKIGRKEEKVLLKVAHNDAAEQIKREAVTLAKLNEVHKHPMLPVLLSPYQYADGAQRPYGKTVYQEETKYFIVLKHAEGEFLRESLRKNPQPWYQHAAWLTINIADALAFLHVKGQHLLLNLSPDSIMVRYDKDGIPRPLLVDLGCVTEPASVEPEQVRRFVPPAYTAPELLERTGSYGAQTDVYGLGLLLYEMLAGHPAHPFRIRAPEDVRNSVRTTPPVALNRSDLSGEVAQIIHMAIDKAPTRRQPDIRTFAKELRKKFGEVPAERKRPRIPRALVAGVAVIVFLLLAWTILMAATGAAG